MGGRAPEGNLAGNLGGTGAAVALALRGADETASGPGRSATQETGAGVRVGKGLGADKRGR